MSVGDPPVYNPWPVASAVSAPAWQRCPVCDGSGRAMDPDCNNWAQTTAIPATWIVCPTCDGKRIISTLTGRPPS